MLKNKGKFLLISALLITLAIVLASCGGGGSTGYVPNPDPNPNPQPEPWTPTGSEQFTGYLYTTNYEDDNEGVMTNDSKEDIIGVVGSQITTSGAEETEVVTWLNEIQPIQNASVISGIGETFEPVGYTDANGYFDLFVPIDDNVDIYEPIELGVEDPFAPGDFLGFEDYFDIDLFQPLSDSQASTLKVVPEEIVLKAGRLEIFKLYGDNLSSLVLKVNDSSVGWVRGPYIKGKTAYAFFKANNIKTDYATTSITISLNGQTLKTIPVEVVKNVASIKGVVTHNGEPAAFGYVKAYGPTLMARLNENGEYLLKKVYMGPSRDVTASYWYMDDAFNFKKGTKTETIAPFNTDTVLNINGGSGTVPTVTPTTGPDPTPTPTEPPSGSWQVITNPTGIDGSPDFSDVHAVSDKIALISSSSGSNIYRTDDGAASFSTQVTSLSTATEAIYMIDSFTGFCGGGSGFVYNTGDGGNNWGFLGAMSSTLADLDFVSASQGYACGDSGAVYSISGGVTNLNSGLASNLAGISAPSVDNVWVCGGGTISYYNGTSFSFQSGPVGSYNSIFFISNQEGWVVGNSGLIGHTINGGNTWTRQTNPSSNSLYDVFFLNTEVGWAVGFNGTILSTANGGDTWTIQGAGLTTAFLRGVHFVSTDNGNVGYVVGNGKTLIKFGGQ